MVDEVAKEREDHSSLFLQPVVSKNPFEETFMQLARAIRLGAVSVGEKLPTERELGEKLNVSRTTVRQAIRGLEKVGYITTRRGRYGGSFVVREEALLHSENGKRKIGPELLETLDFRMVLEPGAVALAAQRAGRSQVEKMRAVVEETEAGDLAVFLRGNCRLHMMFAQATECPPLLQTVAVLEFELMDLLLNTPDIHPNEEHSEAQHREIIDAIAAGDAIAARAAMQTHLAGTDFVLREIATPKQR